MQNQPEIAYHNMTGSPELETDIRERIAKLDKLFDRMIGCRVAVEALHQQHRTGNVYDVHIEMIVPGGELVVSRQPKRAKEKYADPDVHTSVRDAFAAAERQLKEYKEQLKGEVKSHPVPVPGQVAQIFPDQDHGFILTGAGTQLYFHRNSVMDNAFEDLGIGDPVDFVETVGDTGPTAVKVYKRGPARQSRKSA